MTPHDESRKNVNVRTAQLVKLVTELGPDIPEIARRLGQFKESVRYRYKEKVLNKGFAVQATVDHERLGLKRLVLIVDFADEYREYAQAILASMHELCFVVGFSKTLPGGKYVVNVSAPLQFLDEIRQFFKVMREKGMFDQVEILDFEWMRNSPMRAEYYNFDSGRWDFDWSEQSTTDFESANYMPSGQTKFDYVDLLIVKELQKDANKSLKSISEELKMNYKKLAWHYSSHVGAKRLLHGYTINWMGTRYDFKIDKALHRKHRYFAVDFFVKNVTERETMALRQKIDRLPFLWAEAAGRNYFAEFAFPVDYVIEGLQYLAEAITGMKDRAEVFTMDQTDSVAFTIPYPLFDASEKRWVFNQRELIERFDNLLVKIKNEAG